MVRAIIGGVVACLHAVISPSLMERTILSDELQNSTSNAHVPEAFCEKLACNWPEGIVNLGIAPK